MWLDRRSAQRSQRLAITLCWARGAMESVGIHGFELIILLLMIAVVALASLAKKLATPYPIVLVIGGLIISFVPGVPKVALNPDIVFLVILPPLFFSSAYVTSWRAFRYNLVSISMLAFGLVGFTVAGVAAASRMLLPGFTWRSGLVLGSVVSPTDAIAATSIADRLGLPKQVVDVLEGESLVNDASGLLALEFATALLVSGRKPGLGAGTLQLLYLVFGSIAIGLLAGRIIRWLETRIEDAAIEITMSLIAPYLAYLAAESAHSSGVLATVACGMYLGHHRSLYLSTAARLTGEAVWNTLTFILNGIVFILIGLQLPYLLPAVREAGLGRMIAYGLALSGVLILLRLIWMYPGAEVAYQIRHKLLHQDNKRADPRAIFIVGWTGMRGVVALAAAIALPDVLDNGRPFPHRELMIFLTFCVIFVTLVLQGLTLPAVIRKMGLAGTAVRNTNDKQARRAMIDAALAYLEHSRESDDPEFDSIYGDLIRFQQRRREVIEAEGEEQHPTAREHMERYRELARKIRQVQRATILHLRNEGEIDDEVMRRLERELDLVETRFSSEQ
jgi:monovalent cation/hydrogen antiporter